MRKVDIAHSGQTVFEAMEQLEAEVKNAQRGRETMLLRVGNFRPALSGEFHTGADICSPSPGRSGPSARIQPPPRFATLTLTIDR